MGPDPSYVTHFCLTIAWRGMRLERRAPLAESFEVAHDFDTGEKKPLTQMETGRRRMRSGALQNHRFSSAVSAHARERYRY